MTKGLTLVFLISFGIAGAVFGGVGQMNSVYGNQGYGTGYVNPSYPNRAVVATGYYNNYNSWAAGVQGTVAIPLGTVLQDSPSDAVPIMVNGNSYSYESSSNSYFEQVYADGEVVYQAVPPPIGAVVQEIPANCSQQYYNGNLYVLCGSTYYQQVAGGYQVVALQ